MPHGDAVEVRAAEIRQVPIDGRIKLDLATIDEQHHRHRCRHDLGEGGEIEYCRDSHLTRRRKLSSFVILELRESERALMNNSPVLRDEEHSSRSQLAD